MSTINDIVVTYLKHKGLKKISGNENDACPILPLIMMDSAYQLFAKYIKPYECKHELKKWKKDWLESYRLFNKDFFSCFSDEQRDFVVDMMDDFEKYIEHDLFITFVQFENLVIEEPMERQEIVAACMLSNVLCQCAEIIWERIYKHSAYKENKYILACEHILSKWSREYWGKNNRYVNPNESPEICRCIDILCTKQVKYLRLYLEDGKNQ